MTRHYLLTTVVAVLLLAVGFGRIVAADEAEKQAAVEGTVAALIGKLDSDRYLVRERATQQLLEVGGLALDPLLAAAIDDRPEPADRAVWVLRKLGGSEDRHLALDALDRLVQVKNRPAVVADARQSRSRLRLQVCEENLAGLGGQLSIIDIGLADVGVVRTVKVELGDGWRGTPNDLHCLLALDQHHYFRLEGSAVGDEEVKLFEAKDGLQMLQIYVSRVTPPAIDSLKECQPKVIVYVRNRALLGIGGSTHEKGVLVTMAQPKTGAAAAGILPDDVITRLDGKPVKDFDRLTATVAQYEPGRGIDVTILRGDKQLTTRVTLSDWADFEPPATN